MKIKYLPILLFFFFINTLSYAGTKRFLDGEGINSTSTASGFEVACEQASNSNMGIVTPDSSHFTVTNGTMVIKTGSVLPSTVTYSSNSGLFGGFTTDYFLSISSAGTVYLQKSSATNTYLSIANAANLYLAKSSATSTYLSIANAVANYLSQSSATATYLQQSSATAVYLSQSNASDTYVTQSSVTTTYLSIVNAIQTYLSQSSATATYLQLSSATAIYLSQSNAANLYLTLSSASVTYLMPDGDGSGLTGIETGWVENATSSLNMHGNDIIMSASGNSYWTETSADVMAFYVGSEKHFEMTGSSYTIDYSTTGDHIYIYHNTPVEEGGTSFIYAVDKRRLNTSAGEGFFYVHMDQNTANAFETNMYMKCSVLNCATVNTNNLNMTGSVSLNDNTQLNVGTGVDGRFGQRNEGNDQVNISLRCNSTSGTGVLGIKNILHYHSDTGSPLRANPTIGIYATGTTEAMFLSCDGQYGIIEPFVNSGTYAGDGMDGIKLTTDTFVGDTGSLYIENRTGSPYILTNYSTIFSSDVASSSEMFVQDEAGNNTQISAHDPTTGDWIHRDSNTKTGKERYIDMDSVIATLEEISGKQLMFKNKKEYIRYQITKLQESIDEKN